MADDTSTPQPSERARGSERGQRSAGPREGGGFRIRLSDNEMQAARALQEAFGLRSTVAVLGFSLRTLAQQLENGELEELVARQRAQGGGRPPGPRGGERRREDGGGGGGGRSARVDPFARPSRPVSAPVVSEEEPTEAIEASANLTEPELTDAAAASEPSEASAEADTEA